VERWHRKRPSWKLLDDSLLQSVDNGIIGYGVMHPRTVHEMYWSPIEALTGLMGLAMGTGLMFACLPTYSASDVQLSGGYYFL